MMESMRNSMIGTAITQLCTAVSDTATAFWKSVSSAEVPTFLTRTSVTAEADAAPAKQILLGDWIISLFQPSYSILETALKKSGEQLTKAAEDSRDKVSRATEEGIGQVAKSAANGILEATEKGTQHLRANVEGATEVLTQNATAQVKKVSGLVEDGTALFTQNTTAVAEMISKTSSQCKEGIQNQLGSSEEMPPNLIELDD